MGIAKTIKKVAKSGVAKGIKKAIGKTPVGMGLDVVGGVFGKSSKGVRPKKRIPSPQKLAKRLFHAKIIAKINKARMSPYKGL